jgi:hypothetical protein
VFESIEAAIAREKKLKRWCREWKVALIERENPEWRGLGRGVRALIGESSRLSVALGRDDV